MVVSALGHTYMTRSRPMAKVKLDGWRCERCSHTWVNRVATVHPKVCPKCKSPYWDRPRRQPKS